MTYEPAANHARVVHLRPKNQLTVPQDIADRLDLKPGDRLAIETISDDLGSARITRLPKTYLGALRCLWGSDAESEQWLARERTSWDRA